MRVGVVKVLDETVLKRIEKDKMDTIIYASLANNVKYEDLNLNYTLINIYDDFNRLSWYCYHVISDRINFIASKRPNLVTYKGINLKDAIVKDLYWSLLSDIGIEQKLSILEKSQVECVKRYGQRSSFINLSALVRKLLFAKKSNFKLDITFDQGQVSDKIAFRINSPAVMSIYGNLLELLGKTKLISFQSAGNICSTQQVNQMESSFSKNIGQLSEKRENIGMNERLQVFFLNEDSSFKNTFLTVVSRLRMYFDYYEQLVRSGVKKIVVNGGENEGECYVLCKVAHKHDCKVYNYMNGIKANDAHNRNTCFDYWFMPDKNTQDLVFSFNEYKVEQLPVTGHLLNELSDGYKYSGSLDYLKDKLEHKKIISVFTSKLFVSERIVVIKCLKKYIESKPDIAIVIKKHPSETFDITDNSDRIFVISVNNNYSTEQVVFDLILNSNIVISFSSTISLQASWFNKPSINFSLDKKQRLLHVDNKRVFQASSYSELIKCIDTYITSGLGNMVQLQVSSSKVISDVLLHS